MSTLKQWPADGGPVQFEDLLTPCRKALRKGEYQGYDIGARDLACCLSPDERLTPEALERARERGQDRASVVLSIAVQLGIEQGRRLKTEEVARVVGDAIKARRHGEEVDLGELLVAIRGS